MLLGKEIKIKMIEKDIKQQELVMYTSLSKSYISMLLSEKQDISSDIYNSIMAYINLDTENREALKKKWKQDK